MHQAGEPRRRGGEILLDGLPDLRLGHAEARPTKALDHLGRRRGGIGREFRWLRPRTRRPERHGEGGGAAQGEQRGPSPRLLWLQLHSNSLRSPTHPGFLWNTARLNTGSDRRGTMPGPTARLWWMLSLPPGLLPGAAALAQGITVDGRLSSAQTLIGPNYAIGANLGRQVGGNLFHSFGAFGLNRSETATFSGPANVGNIIGRVTGGAPSAIDGIIRSSIQGANLYLINPAGVV